MGERKRLCIGVCAHAHTHTHGRNCLSYCWYYYLGPAVSCSTTCTFSQDKVPTVTVRD